MDQIVHEFGKKAHNASKLVEYLYQYPVVSVGDIIEPLEISKPTAHALIKDFETKGILREFTGFQRNKLYIFDRYLQIYSKE
jgi:DNA-binding MarR family transcriptional regulator